MSDRLPATRFLLGFGALYIVLASLAELDPTARYGVGILAAVLLTAAGVVHMLGGPTPAALGRPTARAVLVALVVAVALQAVFPLVSAITGARLGLKDDWPWLLLGIFAFHGLAEELVWRGYAFQRLRSGRSFGAAVVLTMPLVAATHIPVVASSGVAVGVAAMMVAAVTSLPLAYLFELGRNTLWAPALVHTGIDSFKVVSVPEDIRLTFSLTLAAASLTVPLLALVAHRTTQKRNA